MATASIGRQAEKRAAMMLKEAGLKMVTRNARAGRGEIDLILLDGSTLVFVEVRCRQQSALVAPHESVGWRKQTQVRANAQRWLAANPSYQHHYCRFDVVSISHDHGKLNPPEWIKNAFS